MLAAGLGLAAAAGTVSSGGPVESTGTEVIRAASIGASIALVVGLVAVRLMRHHRLLRTLGVPAALVVIVSCGALVGITTATSESATLAPGAETVADDEPTISAGATRSLGASVDGRRERDRHDITDLQGTIVLAVGLLLLIAAVIHLMRQSELRAARHSAVYLRSDLLLEEQTPEEVADDAAIAEALGRSLAELLSESDPRTAIRAAYGSLLSELSEVGLTRHRYEGPAEYIGRCLSTLTLPREAVSELLHLFEIARFSDHPISAAHAERARRALTVSIDSLSGVTP